MAGISINVLVLLGLGGFVGFLSGLFGVGGGFIMTPLLMMAGIPPAVRDSFVAQTFRDRYTHRRR